jgi:hypothetical protein
MIFDEKSAFATRLKEIAVENTVLMSEVYGQAGHNLDL